MFQAPPHGQARDVSVGEGEPGGPRGGHQSQAGRQEEEVVPDVQGPPLGTVSDARVMVCSNVGLVRGREDTRVK